VASIKLARSRIKTKYIATVFCVVLRVVLRGSAITTFPSQNNAERYAESLGVARDPELAEGLRKRAKPNYSFNMFESFFVPKLEFVGVDLSDRSVKMARVNTRGKETQLFGLFEAEIPLGMLVEGRVKNRDALVGYIQEAFRQPEAKALLAPYVVVTLPEELAAIGERLLYLEDQNGNRIPLKRITVGSNMDVIAVSEAIPGYPFRIVLEEPREVVFAVRTNALWLWIMTVAFFIALQAFIIHWVFYYFKHYGKLTLP